MSCVGSGKSQYRSAWQLPLAAHHQLVVGSGVFQSQAACPLATTPSLPRLMTLSFLHPPHPGVALYQSCGRGRRMRSKSVGLLPYRITLLTLASRHSLLLGR